MMPTVRNAPSPRPRYGASNANGVPTFSTMPEPGRGSARLVDPGLEAAAVAPVGVHVPGIVPVQAPARVAIPDFKMGAGSIGDMPMLPVGAVAPVGVDMPGGVAV